MKVGRGLAAVLLALLISHAAAQQATVVVKGEGDSVYAAQIDASRQALMQVLPQLVSVDRQIINDNVKETILSSANGYIESFQILKESKQEGVVKLEAQVTVSTTAIEQFSTLRRNGPGMALSGSSIMAEIAREKSQSEFVDSFMTRAFTGLPQSAMEFKILKVEKHATQHGVVSMQIQGRLRPDFMKALEAALASIACKAESARKDCVFDVQLFKGYVRSSTFLGGERLTPDWANFKLPKNTPAGYQIVDLLTNRHAGRWLMMGRVLFFDANKRLIKDVQHAPYPAGLEFDFWLPLEGESCTENRPSCRLLISAKPFLIELDFRPDAFGDEFNKVASMEVRSYLNRAVEGRRNKTEAIKNIVCRQVSDYLPLHYTSDQDLSLSQIGKSCQLGYFHARERRVQVRQYYPD